MGFVGKVELLSLLFQSHAEDRLAKADPTRRVGFLAHQVVTLGGVTHRQHVVGEPGGLAPGGSETGMALDLALIRSISIQLMPSGLVHTGL